MKCDRCGFMTCEGKFYYCAWLWAIFLADWIREYWTNRNCICSVCQSVPEGYDPKICPPKCTVGYRLRAVEDHLGGTP